MYIPTLMTIYIRSRSGYYFLCRSDFVIPLLVVMWREIRGSNNSVLFEFGKEAYVLFSITVRIVARCVSFS